MKKHVTLVVNGVNIQIVLEETAIEQLESDITDEVLNPTGKFVTASDYTEKAQDADDELTEPGMIVRLRLSEVSIIIIGRMSNIMVPRTGPRFNPPGLNPVG